MTELTINAIYTEAVLTICDLKHVKINILFCFFAVVLFYPAMAERKKYIILKYLANKRT